MEPGTFFLVSGGDTYLVDAFGVIEPRHWLTTGKALLSHASTLIHERAAGELMSGQFFSSAHMVTSFAKEKLP